MRNGATAHCTTAAKEFLLNKFEGRVLSRGTQNAWSAHFLDLNTLEIYYAKPTTVNELTNVAKRFSEEHRENVLHSVALNVLKRANLYVQQNRGRFQQLL